MANLVTRSDFEALVQLSELGNDAKTLNPHIVNAQNIDLKQALGNALWSDIEANPTNTDPDYVKLLGGGEYTYQDRTYTFSGLKAAIVMYAMARRRASSGSVDTAWGMVQKTSEYSQPVSSAVRQQMVDEARSLAVAYLQECLEYLDRNAESYPLYSPCTKSKVRGQVTLKPISRF